MKKILLAGIFFFLATAAVKAAGSPARIYFETTGTTAKVWLDPRGQELVFATVEIDFDPAVIKLISETEPQTNPLTIAVRKSTSEQANASGKVQLALGLPPNMTGPTRPFELTDLSFSPQTVTARAAQLSLLPAKIQLVDANAHVFTNSLENGALTLPVQAQAPVHVPWWQQIINRLLLVFRNIGR